MSNSLTRDVLVTACAPLVWGTTYYVSTNWLPSSHPLLIGAMRALPIGLILLCIVQKLPQGRWWWRSFVLGFFNIGLFFALLFVAAVRLPGGVAATVGAVQPIFVVLLVWGIFAQRPSLHTIGYASLGLIGVGCLVLSSQIKLDTIGVVGALAGAGAMALGTVLTKHWGRPVTLLTFTAWQLVAGGIFLLPIALIVEGIPQSITVLQILGFVYLGVINTGLAYAVWFRGIERLPTTSLPLLGLLSPVMAVGIGYVALGQSLTWQQLIGVMLILSSVVLSQRNAYISGLKASNQVAG
jgi:probable blue pigment (indigoidine) exporter